MDGRELDLTYLEFELLAHLVARPNRVHTRDQLGAEHRGAIRTVRRVGCKYVPPAGR